jgi:hypothetical protein
MAHKSTDVSKNPTAKTMTNLRIISATAVLVSLSLMIGIVSVKATPETSNLGTSALTPLVSSIMNNVNTMGDDAFSTADPSTMSPPPTQHYGPYMTTNDPDSGTCGNDWATDSFTRFFSIFSQGGSIVVVEQFKDGTFVTPAPAGDLSAGSMSPGACNNFPTNDGGMVAPGITGSLHGYEIIPIPSTAVETSNSPYCDAAGMTNDNCTTATFLNTHFTGCATCQVTTFFFHYSAGDQGLIEHEWTNASPDRGGNRGDIRST